MRKVKHVEIGDYVLLARWRDKSFHDPWVVGHIVECGFDKTGPWYRCEGSRRCFRNCWKISYEEGKQRFADARKQGIKVNESIKQFMEERQRRS